VRDGGREAPRHSAQLYTAQSPSSRRPPAGRPCAPSAPAQAAAAGIAKTVSVAATGASAGPQWPAHTLSSEIPLLMSSRVVRCTRHHAYVNFLLNICARTRRASAPRERIVGSSRRARQDVRGTHVLASVEGLKVGRARCQDLGRHVHLALRLQSLLRPLPVPDKPRHDAKTTSAAGREDPRRQTGANSV